VAVAIIPVIIIIAKVFNVELDQNDLLNLVEAVTSAIAGVMVVFGLSILILLFQLLFTMASRNSGRQLLPLSLLARFDNTALRATDTLRALLLLTIQTLRYIVLVYVPQLLDDALKSAHRVIEVHLELRQSVLRGRKDIRNKGAISFYFKKIDDQLKDRTHGEINEPI